MRKRRFMKSLAMLLCAMLLFSAAPVQAAGEGYDQAMEVAAYVAKNYKFGITLEEAQSHMMRRMMETGLTDYDSVLGFLFEELDSKSEYLTKEAFDSFMAGMADNLSGIGVVIMAKDGNIVVTDVIDGSPAQKMGVLKHDIIKKVDGVPIDGLSLDEVSSRIKGPLGSTVTIEVNRQGRSVTLSLVRANVVKNPVSYRKLDEKTGYLALSSFTGNCAVYVQEALDYFDKEGIKNIMLDLRNNTGGYLTSAVQLGEMFLPEGLIVSVSPKNPDEEERYYSENKNPKYRLAILVNEMTASAAELLSGSAQDAKVARLFGTKTYKKGSVQNIIPLSNGGGIRLTVAQYFTRNGQNVDENAITPDVLVENEILQVSEEAMTPLDPFVFPVQGEVSDNVRAVEERLAVLGVFEEEPDSSYTGETQEAVSLLQALYGLEQTGSVDFNTMFVLQNTEYDLYYYEKDHQFDAAYEYLKSLR